MSAKAITGTNSKVPPPLDLDLSNCVVHNCQSSSDGSTTMLDAYYTKVTVPNSKYGVDKLLINIDAEYEDPKMKKPDVDSALAAANLLVVPTTLSINTAPKKMLKMENKGWKKTPFETDADGGVKLINALDRRFRTVAVMGDYMVIGGFVTLPGYDKIFDEISDSQTLVKTAHENLTLNDIPVDHKGIELPVTYANFSELAVVYINRGDDEEPESRFVVPELCRVTVAQYLFLLQNRLNQSAACGGTEKKIAQYALLIGKFIAMVSDWLRTPGNSPDTVILIYNYRVVSDGSINESEVFSFLDGTPSKPKFDDEKRLANWKYIYTKKNNTYLKISFMAKPRDLAVDEDGKELPGHSDKEVLNDDSIKPFTVTFTCRVPIVPQQRFTLWKKSDEFKKLETEGGLSTRKKKRGEKSSGVSKNTGYARGGKKTKAADDDEDDDDEGDDGDDDDGDDDDDDAASDDEDAEEATKKKKKLANGSAQPSKEDIGKHGTAQETADKVKKAIAAKKNKKLTKNQDASGSADSDEDGSQGPPRKKAPTKDEVAESTAARELSQIGKHTINIKKTDSDQPATPSASKARISIKKASKSSKLADDDDDKEACEHVHPAAPRTESIQNSAEKKNVLPLAADGRDFLVTTKMTNDTVSAEPNIARLMIRRRILKELADMQSAVQKDNLGDEDKFPTYLAYESKYTDDDMAWDEDVNRGMIEMLTGISYIGLPNLFVDAQRRLDEVDQALAADAAAEEKRRKEAEEREEKRKAMEEAALKRKAEKEAAERKAAEEAAKRKAEEEEKKHKAAEEEEKKRKAAKEEEIKRKAAEAAAIAEAAAAAAASKKAEKAKETPTDPAPTPSTTASAGLLARRPGESAIQAMMRLKNAAKK